MTKQLSLASALAAILYFSSTCALAADAAPGQEPAKVGKQEQIYGSQIMTQQERNEYRAKMRGAKTAQEREQIRKEHHEAMKEVARTRGATLPDDPPAQGGGMGPRGGAMGAQGGGMGPGRGNRGN